MSVARRTYVTLVLAPSWIVSTMAVLTALGRLS